MIDSKQKLRETLNYEKKLYAKKHIYIYLPRLSEKSIIWRYICLLRLEEYATNARKQFRKILYRFLRTKMSRRYLMQIPINVVEKGLLIFHVAPMILNAKHIGMNCMMGPNVNMVAQGHTGDSCVLGDNIAIGAGVTIVGGVTIADGIAIGANSLVNKSFDEPGITIAGNPAKKINSRPSSSWGGTKHFDPSTIYKKD